MESKTFIVGSLILVLLLSGTIYITFLNKVKISVNDDVSTFYVKESGIWRVAGKEYNKLYQGLSLKSRDLAGIKVEETHNGNEVIIKRTTPYQVGPVIIDTYYFQGDIKSVDLFPIKHTVEILNGEGFIYQYEARNLVYSGETIKNPISPLSFGRNMKIEWDNQAYWSTLYSSGILKIRFKPDSAYEKYEIRLFDPMQAVLPDPGYALLNSTNLAVNNTNVNLTAWPVSNDSIKVIPNWFVNGNSLMLLNMPFEEINETATNNSWDYSGYNRHGKDIGSTVYWGNIGYDGKGAYNFSSGTQYIQLPTETNLNMNHTTITVWIRPMGFDSNDFIISRGGGTEHDLRLIAGTPSFRALDGSWISVEAASALTLGAWSHLAGTYNGTHLAIYINGVLSNAGVQPRGIPKTTSATYIGAYSLGLTTPAFFFNGTIDEVMIFNRSLSAEQIWNIYMNRTNQIVYTETIDEELWSVCLTPNNGTGDGTSNCDDLLINDCPPVTGQDWIIDAVAVCTAKDIDLSGYSIVIRTGGKLILNGNSRVKADKLLVQRTGDALFVDAGSELYTKVS